MALDLLSIGVGAVVGGAGTLLTSRVTTAETRRATGWKEWLALNDAVRSADVHKVANALGACEIAWAYAGVPRALCEAARSSAWWYQRYFAVFPAGSGVAAPAELYAFHQSVVGGLRYYLNRPWWKPKGRRTAQIAQLSSGVASLGPTVDVFLTAVEAGETWEGDTVTLAEWFGLPDNEAEDGTH